MTPDVLVDPSRPALRCLDFLAAYWHDRGWDLPERRYLAAGSPGQQAIDEEECLYVALSAVGAQAQSARGGVPAAGVSAVNLGRASYSVRLMRVVAGGEEPTGEEIHADGLRIMPDAGRLWHSMQAWQASERTPGVTFELEAVRSEGPMGFSAGHTCTFHIAPAQ